jgi:hypothetical protein
VVRTPLRLAFVNSLQTLLRIGAERFVPRLPGFVSTEGASGVIKILKTMMTLEKQKSRPGDASH